MFPDFQRRTQPSRGRARCGSRHAPPHRQGGGSGHLLSRGGRPFGAEHRALARLPHVVADVPHLIPKLAGRYHVIAPDYPGFGQSGTPARQQFEYRFARFAEVMDELLVQLGVGRYALYVQDYGAPVGYRLALRHPERVTALVVQNGNAYTEGLREFWTPLKAYWADGSSAHRDALRAGLTLDATKSQYLGGVSDPSRVDPDSWIHDQALLERPGVDEIMLDLFKDYGENVALYPQFQAFFRARRPPTLIVWGKNDVIFPAEGARPYLRDLPEAELHLLETGHFALEDKGDEIAALMLDFLGRKL